MEAISADANHMASVIPERKKRGRKPTVYCDNKPIDPNYHKNYYHEVTKKRDFLCPYCSKKFARPYNITRHLEQSNKSCAMLHIRSQHPEIESESETESSEEWARRYSIHNQPPIPDSSPINRWLDHFKENPEPKTQNDWMNAGMLMIQMMLESQKNKE